MTVAFTWRARRDLVRIRAYIARDNPSAAARMAVELIAACERLEMFPERGRLGKQSGTRELTTVWPYIIVYRTKPGAIEILRLWHGRQDR